MDYALLLAEFEARHAAQRWPRQRLLHQCLRNAILNGQLASGSTLLSSRWLAQSLGIARNTVLYAYEQLAAEGLLLTERRRSVVATLPGQHDKATAPLSPPARLAARSQMLNAIPEDSCGIRAFTPGVPDLAAFPLSAWRRLLERVWRNSTLAQLGYGHTQGEPALRQAIAEHLRLTRGARCDARQVFITDGTQHSLDLCARLLADAGDTAWTENPGYNGALSAFLGAQLEVIGKPVDADGMVLTDADWHAPPRLIYLTPSHQYPLGSVLSLPRRVALIAQARRHGTLIIEDDYDSEFRHDGPPLPALQGLEADAPVLYLGTFSKTMLPALRIGFMVVPAGMVASLTNVMARSVPRGRQPEQAALAEFMRSGLFVTHLRRMRRLYAERRDTLIALLQQHLGDIATIGGASAGMHLAIQLPAAYPDLAISHMAASQGLTVRALSPYATPASRLPCNGLVLGYAQIPGEQMAAHVLQLATVIRSCAIGS
ncbi:HTH-type transcriptional regulatory protein GabR [Andreprevotia sp. IGB-42]|uniref:MocR-like pyridoxine biosynthesis transcription factor PdxR n=1 Tax=Andreprevotia sp. IGB-42 TaxID=2497473 RepID=UPI00135C3431|nr:PLP-dependent aminotransferase family protein [Andreprevotia sp. IGB-42]KAF0814970.1 HTH-type transcriptional regulatory protein GabR [Andreprevotia sp. IGB-42]